MAAPRPLLDHQDIQAKIVRLAMEILERNTEETELYVLGINNRGLELARRLVAELKKISEAPIHLRPLRIDPRSPLHPAAEVDGGVVELDGKPVLLVDDVANTGRTLFYALGALQQVLPKKVEVAVLVDRRHKNWPVYVTYAGMILSTTLGDDVLVDFEEGNDRAVIR